MAKKFIAANAIISLLFVGGAIFAMPNFVPANVLPSGGRAVVVIPEGAAQIADNVFDLGLGVDPGTGRVVQGYAIVHYARGAAKPQPGTTACYGFLASGAKWKMVEPWLVNSAGVIVPGATPDATMDEATVFGLLSGGIAKWEDAADGLVNGVQGWDILGDGAITSEDLLSTVSTLDGKNGVSFGLITDSNVIAVTYVWGYFYGAPKYRELVEWDQVYNTSYSWSSTGDPGAMDFDNIATHELGHSVGLADLYNSSCSEETMYGYATWGETKKRDLNAGDILGVSKLY